jgi:hypothetical protein
MDAVPAVLAGTARGGMRRRVWARSQARAGGEMRASDGAQRPGQYLPPAALGGGVRGP